MTDNLVIVNYARTPIGGMQGTFSSLSASDLGANAIKASIERANLDTDKIDNVIMGNVLGAGQGQAPARQAMIKANIPESVGATTINKMCGSGMQAIMMACDSIKAKSCEIVIAGGMESMTNAPYLLDKARSGYRMGHGQVIDHMFLDGLEDAYDKGTLMGVFAENTAAKFNLSRQEQDNFALESLKRAKEAIENGYFNDEITPVEVRLKKETVIIGKDEQPGNAMPEKIPNLKPAFRKDGTVTAANSSSISDGAASVVLMTESKAKMLGLNPVAKILDYVSFAQNPSWFTTAPVGAIDKLLKRLNWQTSNVDLWEINEAFAAVTLAAIKEHNLDHAKVNIHGGACALGHPIGASGARIIATLISALKRNDKKNGVATLCIGGGEATAMAIEMI